MNKEKIIKFEEFEKRRKELNEITDLQAMQIYLEFVNDSVSDYKELISKIADLASMPLKIFLTDYNEEHLKLQKLLGYDLNDIDLRKKDFEFARQTTISLITKLQDLAEDFINHTDKIITDYKRRLEE